MIEKCIERQKPEKSADDVVNASKTWRREISMMEMKPLLEVNETMKPVLEVNETPPTKMKSIPDSHKRILIPTT